MFNRIVVGVARSPMHKFVSSSIVVVEYSGRRSGLPVAVPVNYVLADERSNTRIWITSQRDRKWWRNFQGGYDAILVLQGQRIPVELYALTEEQAVVDGLRCYLEQARGNARYFSVGVDAQGQFRSDDMRRTAAERVMVYADLP